MTLCKAAIGLQSISRVFFAQSWNKNVSGVCAWSLRNIKFNLEWIYQETEHQSRKLNRVVWLIKASLHGDTQIETHIVVGQSTVNLNSLNEQIFY